MKIGVIKTLAGQHSVRKLCRTLGVTRSAYYASEKKPERPRAPFCRDREAATRRLEP